MSAKKIIRLSKSDISQHEVNMVSQVLNNEYLGMGSDVIKFEKQLSEIFQDAEVVCVNSGTAALHLALQAIGIGEGDEVITSSLSYIATHQAIAATGATIIFADIDPMTGSLSLAQIKQKISPKTKAIMPVHYASDSRDMKQLFALAKQNGIRVIEDAAHSFGSKRNGDLVGTDSDIACFSFDGIKNITAGEGGCIITKDINVAEKIRDLRLLGVIGDHSKRAKNERSWQFDVEEQGWRYHMSNINAAIGQAQLQRFPSFQERKAIILEKYLNELEDMQGVTLLQLNYAENVQHILPILIKQNKRDLLRNHLSNLNIQTGVHYFPAHLTSKFRTHDLLPETEWFASNVISLPFHSSLTDDELSFVISAIKHFFNEK